MHKFDPQHAERLLSPERRRWLPPETILAAIGLRSGLTLADVGAGSGFFTLPAATIVGPAGMVYALDVQSEMLEFLRGKIAEAGLANIVPLLSEESRLPLDDGVVDVALLVNVLHESSSREELLRDIARTMRPGGALGLVEWLKVPTPMGPAITERLAPEEAEAALVAAGFANLTKFDAGPYHYGILARVI